MRNLSMVFRGLTHNSNGEEIDGAERKQNYKSSIELANKSIALDLGDSQSWYVLGNAHLTNFFVNNESTQQLELAIKAYN